MCLSCSIIPLINPMILLDWHRRCFLMYHPWFTTFQVHQFAMLLQSLTKLALFFHTLPCPRDVIQPFLRVRITGPAERNSTHSKLTSTLLPCCSAWLDAVFGLGPCLSVDGMWTDIPTDDPALRDQTLMRLTPERYVLSALSLDILHPLAPRRPNTWDFGHTGHNPEHVGPRATLTRPPGTVPLFWMETLFNCRTLWPRSTISIDLYH